MAPPLPEPGPYHAAPRSPLSLTFSPDGTVVLLELAEVFAVRDDATERACAYASGGFDRDDCATYVPGLSYLETCPR